jgi:hypothetical protein
MRNKLFAIVAVLLAARGGLQASDVGHFNGGVFSIRDYFVPPDPGVYGGLWNYGYRTTRLNDNNGNKITTGPLGLTTFDVDVNMYALAPAVIWITPWTILGAKYGAYIAPTFVNSSLDANINTALGRGGNINESSFGVGDLFVQPVWLQWGLPHWDLMVAYGFYAPIGKYDTQTVGPLTFESAGNLGLGYWTQQVQGGVAWYPWTNKATAVTAVLTYEYNSIQQDTDVRYGQILTLNWGISQYLPLNKAETLLLEVGPAGYDAFQITDTSGQQFGDPSNHSQVQSVGGQLGLTYVPWNAELNFHGFYEYYAANRVQGASFGINLVWKF